MPAAGHDGPAALRRRRRYSDLDRATALAALAANGGNVGRTAHHLGIPRGTLQRWIDAGQPGEMGKLVAGQKTRLADKLDELARALLNVTDEKIRRAGLLGCVKAAAIAVDKMLLLQGRPVWIGSFRSRSRPVRWPPRAFGRPSWCAARVPGGAGGGPDPCRRGPESAPSSPLIHVPGEGV
jgi:transposase-like protein